MKKTIKILTIFIAVGILFGGCTDEDTSAPNIEISSPSDGDAFTVDDIIELVGRASDDVALTSFRINSDLGLNETITSFDDPADFPFNVNITLDPNTAPGDYTITVSATDTSGNNGELSKSVTIQ